MIKKSTALVILFLAWTSFSWASPQMGTWQLNEAKSRLPADLGKNTTVTYAAEKGDMVKVTVEGMNKDGKPTHSVWVGKFDGKPYPAKGNLPYNQVSYTMESERVLGIKGMMDGKMVWWGKIEVAADGKSRTVSVNSKDDKGKKMKGVAVYDKK